MFILRSLLLPCQRRCLSEYTHDLSVIPWLFYYSSDSPSKGSNLSHQGPALLTSSNPSYLLKTPSPNAGTLGVRIQHIWAGHGYAVHSRMALVCVLPGVQPSSRAPTGGTVSPHRGVTCFCTWDPQPRFSHPQTCRLLRSPRRLSSSPALARTGPIFKAHLKPHLLQSTFSNLWFTLVISFHEPFQLDVHACQAASVLSDSLRAYPWDRIGSSVHGILQARILEWGALPSSRGSSRPRDWVRVSYISCVDRGGSSPLAPPLQL